MPGGDLGHRKGIDAAGSARGWPALRLGPDHPVQPICVPERQIRSAAATSRSRDDQERQIDGKGASSSGGENLPTLPGRHAYMVPLLQEEQGDARALEQAGTEERDFAHGGHAFGEPCVGIDVKVGDRSRQGVDLVPDFRSSEENERYGDREDGEGSAQFLILGWLDRGLGHRS